jgi:hypothetical protein
MAEAGLSEVGVERGVAGGAVGRPDEIEGGHVPWGPEAGG